MYLLNYFSDVVALLLMWLFISAAIHKLQPGNRQYYQQIMNDYGITHAASALVLRYSLGVIEGGLAIAIVYEPFRPLAAKLSVLLLTVYLAGMLIQLIQGKRDISCGCSGPGSSLKVSWPLIARNAVLALLALCCLAPGTGMPMSLWFAMLMTWAFMVILYLCTENLLANAQKISILRRH